MYSSHKLSPLRNAREMKQPKQRRRKGIKQRRKGGGEERELEWIPFPGLFLGVWNGLVGGEESGKGDGEMGNTNLERARSPPP